MAGPELLKCLPTSILLTIGPGVCPTTGRKSCWVNSQKISFDSFFSDWEGSHTVAPSQPAELSSSHSATCQESQETQLHTRPTFNRFVALYVAICKHGCNELIFAVKADSAYTLHESSADNRCCLYQLVCDQFVFQKPAHQPTVHVPLWNI